MSLTQIVVIGVASLVIASNGAVFCDEKYVGNGDDYRGCQNRTVDGLPCQKWTSQEPHSHRFTDAKYPDGGVGDNNYCRNPSAHDGLWCYTTNPAKRWQNCAPKPTPTCGGTGNGGNCAFPFTYQGADIYGCTTHGKDHRWCQTDTKKGLWGYCDCGNTPNPTTSGPSKAPTTSNPTAAPTKAPTDWYQHPTHKLNITKIEDRLNALAATNANLVTKVTQQTAQINALQATTKKNFLDVNTRLNATILVTNTINNAIQNAVNTFTAVRTQNPTVTSSSCQGTKCIPSIDSEDTKALGIRAPSGEIQLESQKCGQFDPCETNINAMAIQAAMEELKFASEAPR